MSLLFGSRRPVLPGTAAALAVFAAAAPLAAQEPAVPPDAPAGREHVVRRGDTLWDLAAFYLNNPFLWALIYDANRDVVADPHWIYPAERLRIPPYVPVDAVPGELLPDAAPGQPVFTEAPPADSAPVVAAEPAAGTPSDAATSSSSEGRVQPGEFYAAPWLAERRELEPVAELMRPVDRRYEDQKLTEQILPYNRIYLRLRGESRPEVGDRLLLVRTDRNVDGMGRVILPGAVISVSAVDDDVMTAVVVEQFGQVEEGDLALPLVEFPGAAGTLQPVEDGPEGELVAFVDEQPLPAVADRAFIDLGSEQGLAIGDELVVFLPERRAGGRFSQDVPPEIVARLRVVRVRERTATVRVVSMTQPILRPGLPVRLVARVP